MMGICKEIIISVIIIIFVITLNIITQNYTKESIDSTTEQLSQFKDNLKDTIEQKEIRIENEEIKQSEEKIETTEEMEKIEADFNNIIEQWNKKDKVLAYYIEHDELEKVQTELTGIKANIQIKEYEDGIPDIEKCIFILEHIKDKFSLKVKNIF